MEEWPSQRWGWYQLPYFAITHNASLATGLKIPDTDYMGSKIMYSHVIPETSEKMVMIYFSREAEKKFHWNRLELDFCLQMKSSPG